SRRAAPPASPTRALTRDAAAFTAPAAAFLERPTVALAARWARLTASCRARAWAVRPAVPRAAALAAALAALVVLGAVSVAERSHALAVSLPRPPAIRIIRSVSRRVLGAAAVAGRSRMVRRPA